MKLSKLVTLITLLISATPAFAVPTQDNATAAGERPTLGNLDCFYIHMATINRYAQHLSEIGDTHELEIINETRALLLRGIVNMESELGVYGSQEMLTRINDVYSERIAELEENSNTLDWKLESEAALDAQEAFAQAFPYLFDVRVEIDESDLTYFAHSFAILNIVASEAERDFLSNSLNALEPNLSVIVNESNEYLESGDWMNFTRTLLAQATTTNATLNDQLLTGLLSDIAIPQNEEQWRAIYNAQETHMVFTALSKNFEDDLQNNRNVLISNLIREHLIGVLNLPEPMDSETALEHIRQYNFWNEYMMRFLKSNKVKWTDQETASNILKQVFVEANTQFAQGIDYKANIAHLNTALLRLNGIRLVYGNFEEPQHDEL